MTVGRGQSVQRKEVTEMAGQPQIPPFFVFDVTNLEVTAEPGLAPPTIVRKSDDFELTATFSGAGIWWNVLEMISDLPDVEVAGMVTFSAEGLGADADEEDFGPEPEVLTVGGSPYTSTTTVPGNTLDVGVYVMACWVEFQVRVGTDVVNLPGIFGHYKGLGPNQETLSVYEH
jgi:hypothetical protein